VHFTITPHRDKQYSISPIAMLVQRAPQSLILDFLTHQKYRLATNPRALKHLRTAAKLLVSNHECSTIARVMLKETQTHVWQLQNAQRNLKNNHRQGALQALLMFYEHNLKIDPGVTVYEIHRSSFLCRVGGAGRAQCYIVPWSKYRDNSRYVFRADASRGQDVRMSVSKGAVFALRYLISQKIHDDVLRHILLFLRASSFSQDDWERLFF
jgi:hypothetical protein